MHILGISAFFHDSAACVVVDGDVVAAAQEERFSRVKNDAAFPARAVQACLDEVGISMDRIDMVAFHEKPHLKFERILMNARANYPDGFEAFAQAGSSWSQRKFWTPTVIRRRLAGLSPTGGRGMRWDGRIIFPRHHQSHAASAFYPSPFDEAAILTVDGVGEWATTSLAVGSLDERGVPRMRFLKEVRYPDSLGLFYSAFTRYVGFEVNEGEYKMMGLAPYGTPRFVDLMLDRLLHVHDDASFSLNMDYFTFQRGLEMFGQPFCDLFGQPMRAPDAPVEQFHMDVAASAQVVTERVMEGLAAHLHELTGSANLCLAGGVALNCVANGRLQATGPFRDVWVQPAAGDAGGSLGAALYAWHEVLGERRPPRPAGADGMHGALLGPTYDREQCRRALESAHLQYAEAADDEALVDEVAGMLGDGLIVGWCRGPMEFGPRALGCRSILADPRSPAMQRQLNLRVKSRESFRPLAPSVLRHKAHEWFELAGRADSMLGTPETGYDSPYMLLVAPIAKEKRCEVEHEPEGFERLNVPRSLIAACTHVDGSARIQTVTREDNPVYFDLLSAFERRTGVPVLVNTSFNVRGEPIVCSPDDAVRCFLTTEIDVLVLERFIARKALVEGARPARATEPRQSVR